MADSNPGGETPATTMLRTMGEMSKYLRRKGYISRTKDVLMRYAKDGVESASGDRIKLRSVKMNKIHYSSEAWFQDFLSRLEGN